MISRTILSTLLILISLTSAGEYHNYNINFFFGRQPSARAEAMGRTMVASRDNAFSSFYNPATLFLSRGLNAAYSHADPYYIARKANFTFMGISCHLEKFGAVGVSRFRFSYGEDLYSPIGSGNPDYETFIPVTEMYTLSYSQEIMNNLLVGLNLNYYRDELSSRVKATGYPLDAGLLKIIPLKNEDNNRQEMRFGLSLKNLLQSQITILDHPENLPSLLQAGLAYQARFHRQDYLPGLYSLGLLIQADYQDILNDRYRSGIHAGAEISLLEILSLRLGYYSIKLDPSPGNGKEKLTDFTYGFGVNLPFDAFVKSQFPLSLSLDITSLKQPSYIIDYEWPRFTVYSLNLQWQ